MKSLFIIIICAVILLGCKKSGSSVTPPPSCDDFCKLTSSKWRIVSETIKTDGGTYNYNENQLADIPWSTFLFKDDSTYIDFAGETGPYSYKESDKSLTIEYAHLPLKFTVSTLLATSLTFTDDKVNMNPQTDTSAEANFAIQEIAGDLHDDFGVDTSKIKYFQASWSYNH